MRPAILLVLIAVPAALAWHEDPWRCRMEGIVEVTQGPEGRTFYLDVHEDAVRAGAVLYEESNGLWHPKPAGIYRDGETEADLQRGGPSAYIPDDGAWPCPDEALLAPDVLHV